MGERWCSQRSAAMMDFAAIAMCGVNCVGAGAECGDTYGARARGRPGVQGGFMDMGALRVQ